MTIKDIAKECGCAVGTVSRVLNNQNYVSKETRQKILEVVEKYDFVLNKNAKNLKAKKSKTIVIIIKGISNLLFYNILEILQHKIETLSYTTSVIILDELSDEAQRAWNIYCEKKPLGFIFLGGNPESNAEDFAKIKVPCVLISTKPTTNSFKNLSSISTDEYQASLSIARYFAKMGHQKIGIIGGEFEKSEIAKNRYAGFLEGLEIEELNFDYKKSYEVARYSLESGGHAAERLLKKFPDLTAIFCMSDVMAIGACRKLKELNLKVPEDISIIGFDGLSIADYYCPKITTIRQSVEDLALQGLKMFLDCIEKQKPCTQKIIPFKFIEGESVKQI